MVSIGFGPKLLAPHEVWYKGLMVGRIQVFLGIVLKRCLIVVFVEGEVAGALSRSGYKKTFYRPRLRKRHESGTAHVSKGRCMSPRVQRSLSESTWPKVASQNDWATQGTVLAAAGGVSPDIKFNIFLHPHISERAPF